jgi:bacteriorhodopsin
MALVTGTFYITYVMLVTTATITIIEAISTKSSTIRHIMNLESCISIVAAFFYTRFIKMLGQKNLKWSDITHTRYLDWFITTPMMLLVLCMVLAYNNRETVHAPLYILVFFLNVGMLTSGYLGETHHVSKMVALVIGFLFFFAMFALIYKRYIARATKNFMNNVIFYIFLGVWSMYGVAFMMSDVPKNVMYNILDLIAKCIVGLGLWSYYTKVLKYDTQL